MFSGGDYEEVARWLRNFVASHAKRENLRVEPEVDSEGSREGQSYGVRLRLGRSVMPPRSEPPLELAFADVARNRGSLAWCAELAGRVRALARGLSGTPAAQSRTA
ncbi:MAG TPA: hypothetical protein VFE48_17185 [Methylomirabilota bacterium]|nr:hypothetical protein [Methylomirabilota bacterium]